MCEETDSITFKVQCDFICDQFDYRIFERFFRITRDFYFDIMDLVNLLHCGWSEAILAPRDW